VGGRQGMLYFVVVLGCDFIFLCGFLPFHFVVSGNYFWMIIRFGVTAWGK